MVTLENAILKASVSPKGAELQSLFHKDNSVEYLWNGDPAFWNKHSPVLFPIVGGLKDNTYIYNNIEYNLPRHGFARDMEFVKERVFGDSCSFVLKNNEDTQKVYPFEFLLRIKYQLNANSVTITYEVENPGAEPLLFSIGTHPAFQVPLIKGTTYEDYYFHFSELENSNRWTLKNNLIAEPVDYFKDQDKLSLNPNLFYDDALVFKDLKSTRISICSDKTTHGLHCDFAGFPYMGLWAAKDAPFVCIEPWYGIADSINHNQKLEQKEGIIKLESGGSWNAKWSISCF
ncbi:aldose 1-epimerase family protein [Desertivirga brevis]|uniref:aldose 1-epimerase family protein n=1 Tax=Desertivirga brevis TaxID=2810310 RepID=UPI001A96CEBC|nr:aldose 1-epimerase family protein [Pedobacter sp. SYSU D00873]